MAEKVTFYWRFFADFVSWLSNCLKSYKLLKTFDLHQKGIGKVQVTGRQLAAGAYVYTLIVDGKTIDTKQMILTQ